MFLNKIELKNFRNYESLNLDFNSNKILLIGKNAQGKTNLLEAVFYLSNLSSLRAKTDSELIKWGKDFTVIKANIKKGDFDIDSEVVINPPKKKLLKINGIKKNKSSEFIQNLLTVSFSTSDLLLLRGTPDDRRNWLDTAISQIYPAYMDRLSKYNKIRIQKNNYLKEIKGNTFIGSQLLDVWNEQMSITGSNIIFLRLKFLKEIIKIAQEKHSQISASETLTLTYNSSLVGDFEVVKDELPAIETICTKFSEKLEEKKQEEIIRGQSIIGPHRDDLSYFINDVDSKKFASQGQQRTIVLALKLAELDLIKNKTGENAVLLLDDVLAELDDLRQNYLLSAIGNEIQTIITSVDTLHFDEKYLKEVEVFKISASENNTKIESGI